MKTHEQNIRENPQRVRDNRAAMIAEQIDAMTKLGNPRSSASKAKWLGRVRWTTKMIARYDDDLRLIEVQS